MKLLFAIAFISLSPLLSAQEGVSSPREKVYNFDSESIDGRRHRPEGMSLRHKGRAKFFCDAYDKNLRAWGQCQVCLKFKDNPQEFRQCMKGREKLETLIYGGVTPFNVYFRDPSSNLLFGENVHGGPGLILQINQNKFKEKYGDQRLTLLRVDGTLYFGFKKLDDDRGTIDAMLNFDQNSYYKNEGIPFVIAHGTDIRFFANNLVTADVNLDFHIGVAGSSDEDLGKAVSENGNDQIIIFEAGAVTSLNNSFHRNKDLDYFEIGTIPPPAVGDTMVGVGPRLGVRYFGSYLNSAELDLSAKREFYVGFGPRNSEFDYSVKGDLRWNMNLDISQNRNLIIPFVTVEHLMGQEGQGRTIVLSGVNMLFYLF